MGRDYLTPQLINHVVFSSATPPRLTNTVNPVLIIQLAVCQLGGPLTSSVRRPSSSPCSFLFKSADKRANEKRSSIIQLSLSRWEQGVIDKPKATTTSHQGYKLGRVFFNQTSESRTAQLRLHHNLKGSI